MELNQCVHNFTVCRREEVSELEAVLYEMEHPSGAKLVWLNRAEINKTFGIAFQTQPWDDTGVFHILEHSVLCGSQNYPVKEPFVELMKSSLNTFLNALTFWDKTFYPVSSRNDQDFVNLIRVYMDAVLHPLIHSKPEIFYQEGWHYEFSESGELSYKGVVFNEMKGSFASPDTLSGYELARRLFPDTCYRFVSGGDPEHIPELTYEQFAATHKRLYHPSNSYIVLDGQIDIEKILALLDEEFLSAYDRIPTPGDIPYQQPVDGGISEITYELSSQEELAGRARLIDGFVAGDFRDRQELMALHTLSDVLCGDNQAPLKRCLLEAGLARDLTMEVNSGILQTYVSLEAKDVNEGQFDQVSDTLYGEVERLVQKGLDHKRILATLDNLEFQERERDYGRMPQGLGFAIHILDSWLYGGNPAANLTVGDLFDQLRKKCEEGYFEGLLEQVLLKNPHRARVLMRPSHTEGQARQERENQRLQEAASAWSEDEKTLIRERQEKTEAWQNTPDTPEALSTIPLLRLDQIPTDPEVLPISEETIEGLKVLRHALPTGGISYLNLYFDLNGLSPTQLTQTAFLARLLGSLETDEHSLEELQREMRAWLGRLQFKVEPYSQKDCLDQCRSFLCASLSVLDTKLDHAVALLAEILTQTHWNDPKRVYEFLCQHRASFAEQLAEAGHASALSRVQACCSAEGVVNELSGGVEYYRWLKDLEANFDEYFPSLAKDLERLAGNIINRTMLTLSVTGSNEKAAPVAAGILNSRLPQGTSAPAFSSAKPWGNRREGIVIPADVSYAALGGRFEKAGTGQAKVMGRAASLAYLWNAVRVQGGAYGVGMVLQGIGFGGFYSYRDPSAARTLDCYSATAEFLRGLGETDLTGMIIGAVTESDPLLTPRLKGKTADGRYWRGISRDDLRQTRQEILASTPSDILALAEDVEHLTAQGAVCVLGSQRQIDGCGEKLDNITVL